MQDSSAGMASEAARAEEPGRSSRAAIGAALLLPVVLWITLPVRLHQEQGDVRGAECLTLAEPGLAPAPGSIATLERCTAMLDQDTDLLADLGAAYEAAGEPSRAVATYRAALAIDPSLPDVHLRLARLHLTAGAAADARRHAAAALAIQPNRRAVIDVLTAAGGLVPTP